MLASSHRHAVQAGLQRVLGCQMSPMAAALLATRRAVAAASAAPGDNSGSGDAGGSAGAVIAPPNIPKLAQMAQISVTEEEVRGLAGRQRVQGQHVASQPAECAACARLRAPACQTLHRACVCPPPVL
jgi:hypothetical protein